MVPGLRRPYCRNGAVRGGWGPGGRVEKSGGTQRQPRRAAAVCIPATALPAITSLPRSDCIPACICAHVPAQAFLGASRRTPPPTATLSPPLCLSPRAAPGFLVFPALLLLAESCRGSREDGVIRKTTSKVEWLETKYLLRMKGASPAPAPALGSVLYPPWAVCPLHCSLSRFFAIWCSKH